jgi:excisionase family DNA binding protein
MSKNQPCEWLTAKEVGEIFKVSAKTVNRWRRDGLLRGVKIGNVVRFARQDVDDFANRSRG